MRYNASRGGHAPGHYRDAFWDWVDAGMPSTLRFGWDNEEKSATWLIGQLWNCSDIMPCNGCEELELPLGSTYARAVRLMKQYIVP